jgi:hydroxypyruvate isomerase
MSDLGITRRTALGTGVALASSTAVLPHLTAQPESASLKGNIRHSVVFWCFNVAGEKWSAARTAQVAKELGCRSVELIDPEHWPMLKAQGLTCAIAGNGLKRLPFMYGLNNPAFQQEVIASTRKTIEQCAEAGVPSVIAFVGYKWRDPENPMSGEIPRDDAFKHCVAGLKELARDAEAKKVRICVEHLNTRDNTHPMKGHPGYQGDDLDFVMEILRAVGSPWVKLLFDIYHVQIMHGDLIRRLDQCREFLGHIHTAGNPGRAELDADQEINYAAVMRKLVQLKYSGYVGHEFIPTRNPYEGLRQAIRVCDV